MPDRPISAKQVEQFHGLSDVDKRPESQHHRIGLGANQVASGRHTHNGADSLLLLPGLVITGSRTTDVASILQQILTALSGLGVSNGTTP